MKRYLGATIALWLLLTFPAFSGPAMAAWNLERVEAPRYFDNTFGPRALALDSLGRPHIAYGGDNLYHAWYNGTSWTVETIPDWSNRIGLYASIAIDSSDHVHISCYDSTNRQLMYATNASGSWVLTTVTTTGGGMYSCIAINGSGLPAIVSVNSTLNWVVFSETDGTNWTSATIHTGTTLRYTTLAFDSGGNAHVAFLQTTVRYMNNVGGSWAAATEVYAVASEYPCLALDLSDNPHISVRSSGSDKLVHVYNVGLGWTTQDIDASASLGQYSSIAVDGAGNLHVSYYRLGTGDLRYAYYNGVSWTQGDVEITGNTGQSTSIAVDSANKPYISFLNINEQSVRLAEGPSASWTFTNADRRTTAGLSPASSMGLDSADKAHICFYDNHATAAYYTSNQTGAWVKEMLDGAAVDAGQYSSLAVDSTDKVHVAYYVYDITRAAYVTGTAGAWSAPAQTDTVADTGDYCQLAVDPSNQPHVTHYYNGGSPDIRWSHLSGGIWTGETLLSSGEVSNKETPIAVDSAGNLHVAFQSFAGIGNYNLRYGKYDGVSWSFEDVVMSGDVGDHCSIAVDSAGYAHISFFNGAGAGYLTYVTNKTGAWVVETVDPVGVSGVYSDIAVDSEGYVHIAYSFDGATNFLKYATNKTGSWVLETVDNVGDVGECCSIALDSNDLPHISYNDATNFDIKYAWLAPTLYTLNVAVSPTGGGTVTGSGINCPGDCTETYLAGTPVELTAAPAVDYTFDHWTGALTGTTNPQSLTMDGDKTATGVFLAASPPPPAPSEAYSVTFPAGSTADAFRIMSVPLVPVDPSPAAVLGSQIGTYDPNTMRIGYWDAEAQAYVEYPFSASLEPGRSGWFLFRNGKTLTVEGSPTPLTSGLLGPGYYYPINQGWNMLGNPCLNAVDLIDAMVIDADSTHAYLSDPANTITQQVFWVYGNGTYRAASTLGVTEGGWIKKLTPGWGQIFIPAAYPDRDRAASVPVTDDLERPPAPPAGLDQPSAGGGGGGGCFLGVLH